MDASRACRCRRVLRNYCFVFGSACMMDLIETNPPRRGGPPCPPARENIAVGFCPDALLAVNGLPLARRMHAYAAGRYETTVFCLVRLLCDCLLKQILCVGADRRVRPRVTDVPCGCDLESLRIRLRGGCIPCVPMPPGVTKPLFSVWSGFYDGSY